MQTNVVECKLRINTPVRRSNRMRKREKLFSAKLMYRNISFFIKVMLLSEERCMLFCMYMSFRAVRVVSRIRNKSEPISIFIKHMVTSNQGKYLSTINKLNSSTLIQYSSLADPSWIQHFSSLFLLRSLSGTSNNYITTLILKLSRTYPIYIYNSNWMFSSVNCY